MSPLKNKSISLLGAMCQKNKQSIAFDVIYGMKNNILYTNFMYSI